MLSDVSLALAGVGWVYNLVLTSFRLSVNEIDLNFSSPVYGLKSAGYDFACFSAVTGAAGLLSQYLRSATDSKIPSNTYYLEFGLVAASLLLVRRINRTYVQGRKFIHVDLTGKVFIVTGCNTGIGYETAREIINMNGTVIMACRSLDKANQAKQAIIRDLKCSSTKLIVLQLDLCSFSSVRNFVKQFHSLSMPLHCLVNNAGLMIHDRMVTDAGLEMVLTANHFSHFLLSNLLLPALEKSSKNTTFVSRIVTLSSALHHNSTKGMNFDDIMFEKGYELFASYSQSKLANILFTKGLQRRLSAKGSSVVCHSVHPGCVRTEVTRHMHPLMQFLNTMVSPLLMTLQKSPPQGAYCSIHVATSPDPSAGTDSARVAAARIADKDSTIIAGRGGLHYFHCEPVTVSASAMDEGQADRLWEISEELTGLKRREDGLAS